MLRYLHSYTIYDSKFCIVDNLYKAFFKLITQVKPEKKNEDILNLPLLMTYMALKKQYINTNGYNLIKKLPIIYLS